MSGRLGQANLDRLFLVIMMKLFANNTNKSPILKHVMHIKLLSICHDSKALRRIINHAKFKLHMLCLGCICTHNKKIKLTKFPLNYLSLWKISAASQVLYFHGGSRRRKVISPSGYLGQSSSCWFVLEFWLG